MAERPYVSFTEVKQKVSLIDVLEAFGIANSFRPIGKTLTGVCPLPGHAHGPSPNPEQFKINFKGGLYLWHCFGDCQKGGDVVEFVKEMTGFDNTHVRFWFADKFPDRLKLRKGKTSSGSTASPSAPSLPKEKARANACEAIPQRADSEESSTIVPDTAPPLKPLRFHLNLDSDVPYLRQRRLTPETIQKFGLGLCKKGMLKGYVAIPVYDHPRAADENPIGYLGRWPGEDFDRDGQDGGRPRYKFPPDFPRNRVIYGLTEALGTANIRPLIIVEGPFKLYDLVQKGFENTVATFGASLSDEQARILAQTGRQLILMFDGDEAGQKGMRLAAGKLITQAFVRVARLPAGSDPESLSAIQIGELLT